MGVTEERAENRSNGQDVSVTLDPATTVGAVTLAVASLETMVRFYQDVIGLTVLERTVERAALGVGTTSLVRLMARPDGKQDPQAPGLFHLALLLPGRPELGHWLRHLAQHGYPLDGAGDHLVSEALYLTDPEGNGIEIYRDRPRNQWSYENGRIHMDTLRMDLPALVNDAPDAPWTGMPAETTMGHVHLQVNNVNEAIDFYANVLGFDLMALWSGAGFMSAGGYHHHLGMNTWRSAGSSPRGETRLGLLDFEIVLPSAQALSARLDHMTKLNRAPVENERGLITHDPAGNAIRLLVGENG